MDFSGLEEWVLWIGAFSVVTFLGSLIVVPWLIIQMPADYFVRDKPQVYRHPVARVSLLIIKNVFGVLFLLAGLIMLVTPGQGILSILVGLSLLNFPGKRKLEQRIIANARIERVLNALRAKAGKPPLIRNV